ncbi:MAG: ABC transporter ATP-binding protein [Deltaproteobacteria bacterium]|nr:ABC transporter ATP-binding protein [Deltaproteobacteria bacterium]
MSAIQAEGLSVMIGRAPIVSSLTFSVNEGSFVAVVGPSGAGKTTTLRAIAGLTPHGGSLRVFGEEVQNVDKKRLARTIAVLRQDESIELEFTVSEVVHMGRAPHHGLFDPDTQEDAELVRKALALARADHLAPRSFLSLSSGERQRVLLARAIAQSPRILLLDEPTSHLDVGHQLDVIDSIKALGLTVVAALHDLNVALTFADEALVLSEGSLVASGSAAKILEPKTLSRVFGVEVERLEAPSGRSFLAFSKLRVGSRQS